MGETVFIEISLIIISCAALSWLALVLRQPLIVAYLAGGFLMGFSGLGMVGDTAFLDGVSGLGITLLLFLAGLVLLWSLSTASPYNPFLSLFKKTVRLI